MSLTTNEEVIQMLKLQEQLNIAYMGADWKEKFTNGKCYAAMLSEVGEFLNEVEGLWKLWKSNPTFDREKAIFEFIDVVHFMLMILLKNHDLNYLVNEVVPTEFSQSFVDEEEDHLSGFSETIALFIGQASDEYDAVGLMRDAMDHAGIILEMKPGDIFEAYEKKNKLNFERALGGKDYDRQTERTLTMD